jgi:hypothetical protein
MTRGEPPESFERFNGPDGRPLHLPSDGASLRAQLIRAGRLKPGGGFFAGHSFAGELRLPNGQIWPTLRMLGSKEEREAAMRPERWRPESHDVSERAASQGLAAVENRRR